MGGCPLRPTDEDEKAPEELYAKVGLTTTLDEDDELVYYYLSLRPLV